MFITLRHRPGKWKIDGLWFSVAGVIARNKKFDSHAANVIPEMFAVGTFELIAVTQQGSVDTIQVSFGIDEKVDILRRAFDAEMLQGDVTEKRRMECAIDPAPPRCAAACPRRGLSARSVCRLPSVGPARGS